MRECDTGSAHGDPLRHKCCNDRDELLRLAHFAITTLDQFACLEALGERVTNHSLGPLYLRLRATVKKVS